MNPQFDTETGVTSGGEKEVTSLSNKSKMKGWDVIMMRFVALVLSMAAALVIGFNRQTKSIALPTSPPVTIQLIAKYQYLSAYVFFVVANCIACAYAAISLLLTLAKMSEKKRVSMMIIIFDLAVVALLFSSTGAATAIGLLAYKGNSYVQWARVCNRFERFCNHGIVGVCLSSGAAGLFLFLVVLATFNLHKKH